MLRINNGQLKLSHVHYRHWLQFASGMLDAVLLPRTDVEHLDQFQYHVGQFVQEVVHSGNNGEELLRHSCYPKLSVPLESFERSTDFFTSPETSVDALSPADHPDPMDLMSQSQLDPEYATPVADQRKQIFALFRGQTNEMLRLASRFYCSEEFSKTGHDLLVHCVQLLKNDIIDRFGSSTQLPEVDLHSLPEAASSQQLLNLQGPIRNNAIRERGNKRYRRYNEGSKSTIF